MGTFPADRYYWDEVVQASSVGQNAVLVAYVLSHHQNQHTRRCNPGIRLLSERTRQGGATVRAALAELVDAGLLAILKKGAGKASSEYDLVLPDFLPPVRPTKEEARSPETLALYKRVGTVSVSSTDTLSHGHEAADMDPTLPSVSSTDTLGDGHASVAYLAEEASVSGETASVSGTERSVSSTATEQLRTTLTTTPNSRSKAAPSRGGITGKAQPTAPAPIVSFSTAPPPPGASDEAWTKCKAVILDCWEAWNVKPEEPGVKADTERLYDEWHKFRLAGVWVEKVAGIVDRGEQPRRLLVRELTETLVPGKPVYGAMDSMVGDMMARTITIEQRTQQYSIPQQGAYDMVALIDNMGKPVEDRVPITTTIEEDA